MQKRAQCGGNSLQLRRPGEREKEIKQREREREREHTHPEVSKANFQEESRPDATRGRQPLFIYFCLSWLSVIYSECAV